MYSQDNYVDVDGIKTHYIEQGTGDPIVLIHGGGAGADCVGNWRGVIPGLAEEYRVIALDMVGFGRTDKPNGGFEYSQDSRNKHLDGFLNAMGLDKVMLVGNSMGGATALGATVLNQDRTTKLLLMGSAGLNAEIHKDLLPIVDYDFTREGMKRLIEALTADNFKYEEDMVDHRFGLATDPETRRAYSETMQWIKGNGGLHYDEDFIRQVKVQTMVVHGKDDKVIPLSAGYRFLELIDDSYGYIVPECGHWAIIEYPEEFAAITKFFAKQ